MNQGSRIQDIIRTLRRLEDDAQRVAGDADELISDPEDLEDQGHDSPSSPTFSQEQTDRAVIALGRWLYNEISLQEREHIFGNRQNDLAFRELYDGAVERLPAPSWGPLVEWPPVKLPLENAGAA